MATISMSAKSLRRCAKHHAADAAVAVDADLDSSCRCSPDQYVDVRSFGSEQAIRRSSTTWPTVKPKCLNRSLAGAEAPNVSHADHGAGRADVTPPAVAQRRPRPRRAVTPAGSTLLALGGILRVEHARAGHRHHAHAPALLAAARFAASTRERHFRARRDHDALAACLRNRAARSRRARSPATCSRVARLRRQCLARQHQARRAVVRARSPAQATAVSTASQGRQTVMFGIRRRLARCSTGWCVGPSSPRPMESWV